MMMNNQVRLNNKVGKKKELCYYVIAAMSVIAFVSCGNKLAFNSFIGKWDMTNDKES